MSRERAPTESITSVIDARERGDVAFLVERLADPNQEVRWVAANSLRKLGAAEAVEPLLRIAENPSDESFRVLALKAVGESAIPRLLEIAAADEPEAVRTTAVDALVRLDARGAVPALVVLVRAESARRLVDLRATEAVVDLRVASKQGGLLTRLSIWRTAQKLQAMEEKA